ncbi:peptidyl-tRNA hydrolase [Vibrio crassostreae]|uniref:peptidyl-tRNA hydrolase n=1 Tax=Vibrio crassostreae TaxID=246167 RepID=UPI001B316D79|nr:peptidyl-tRNA hydrolase [Vibrio crassostreae]
MLFVANKNLKLRRGKWAAQLSHALMKLLLQSCHKDSSGNLEIEQDKLKHIKNYVDKLVNNPSSIKIEWVDSQKLLEEAENRAPQFTASIVDYGRTEFHGVKTKTCLVIDDDSVLKQVSTHTFSEEAVNAKQVVAIRDNLKLTKQEQFGLAVSGSNKKLISCFAYDTDKYVLTKEGNKELFNWLSGAFAKICVRFSEQTELEERISSFNMKELVTTIHKENDLVCAVFTACTNKELEGVTSDLKLY